MALQQRLVQKQVQNLAMTKQLRHAIELLELSTLELHQTLEGYAEENPLLILEEAETDASDSDRGDEPREDMSFDNQFHDGGRNSPPPNRSNPYNEFGMENIEGDAPSLYNYMESQIRTKCPDPTEQFLAFAFLNYLEPSGYLSLEEDEFCKRLGCSKDNFNRMLDLLQHLDPPGIFARNLKECLGLQLEAKGDLTPRFIIFLEHLDLLGKGDLAKLGKVCGCELDELKEMIQDLRDLDPKPGLAFDSSDIPQRQPDAFVWIDLETQEVQVRMDDRFAPRLRIDEGFTQGFTRQDKDFKSYVSDRMSQAQWLLKALNQRQENFMKITKALGDAQRAFFEKGVTGLKPMTLKQIAETVGVHESTVSRITQNKYIGCSQGVFELKFFFSASISNAWTGEDQSALAIQHAIQKLVDEEPQNKPLSDDQLVKILCEMDISVARRTVTKYRELMNIPSSYDRARRYKLVG